MVEPISRIPITTGDSTIKKLFSFYKMGCRVAKENNLHGINALIVKIQVVTFSFRLFKIIEQQQETMTRSLSGLVRMVQTQKDLNQLGVAYIPPGENADTPIDLTSEDHANHVLNSIDHTKMPKN